MVARADPPRVPRTRALAPLLACCAALALAGCSSGSSAGSTHSQSTSAAAGAGSHPAVDCEGAQALCARRLDAVVLPATHNSYAASEQPGWYFASQRYGIPRQLRDGIRAFLIDVHMGVADPSRKLVRTDFAAEGSDRNKVVRTVPPAALAVAERLGGPLGATSLSGTPEPYLCHTLCELGAEPLVPELKTVGSFLREHPNEVIVLVVEDYVRPAVIEGAFSQAGLLPYVATFDRHSPLPTLGELVAGGHRLVVLAEKEGGSPSWYMPAFSFIQDTPLGAIRPDQLSCTRYRGEQSSPLLLINHWIPPFPPSASLNRAIGLAPFLRARIRRCLAERHAHGAIVAVDFYNGSAVVKVARELNAR
jgi:hypothetical protein